jgi:hypothetical protein
VRHTLGLYGFVICLSLAPGTGAGVAWASDNRASPDNPGSVIHVRNIDTAGETLGIAVSPPYAYLISGGDLLVIDISTPTKLLTLAKVITPGQAQDVAIKQHYAYVADYFKGLQVIDITHPNAPRIIAHTDIPGAALNLSLWGDHVYVTNGRSLQIIDISSPSRPRRVGHIAMAGQALGVDIVWPYAYVAAGSAGLQIIKISDAEHPLLIGEVDTPDEAQNVAVSGKYAYVADSVSLQVVNVSVPAKPRIVNQVGISSFDIALWGHYAYVAAGWGLQVIDISTPDLPRPVFGSTTTGFTRRVAVVEGTAYLSDSERFTVVSQTTNPARPLNHPAGRPQP